MDIGKIRELSKALNETADGVRSGQEDYVVLSFEKATEIADVLNYAADELEATTRDRDLARGAIKASRDTLRSPDGETLYDATGRVSADLGRAREEIERLKAWAIRGWNEALDASKNEGNGQGVDEAINALNSIEIGDACPPEKAR